MRNLKSKQNKIIVLVFLFVLFLSNSISAQLSKTGLMLWYKMNGSAIDYSCHNYQGTIVGTTNNTTNRFNEASKALNFDGSTSSIIASQNVWSDSMTISVWFKATSYGNTDPGSAGKGIVFKAINTGYMQDYSLAVAYISGVPKVTFTFGEGNASTYSALISNTNLVLSTWYNVVITRGGGSLKMYINGFLDNYASYSFTPTNHFYPLKIGTTHNSFQTFQGSIDEIRLYNRVIPISEVQTIYTEAQCVLSIPQIVATSVCYGDSAIITSPNGQGYLYYDSLYCGNLIGTGSTFISPVLTSPKTYYVANSNSQCETEAVPFTININSLPLVSMTSLPQNVCSNETPFGLSGTPLGGTFNGNGVVGTTFYPSVAGVGNKTITYSYTNASNCSSSVSQIIDVKAIPSVNVGSDTSIIYNTFAQLHSNIDVGLSGFNFHWLPADSLINPLSQNPTTKNLYQNNQFILSVTETTYNCTSTDSVQVNVIILPIVSTLVPNKTTICKLETVQITANSQGGIGIYNYSWSSIPTGFNSNSASINVTPLVSTKYIVTVTDGTLFDVDTVLINVNQLPNITLGNDTLLCNVSNFVLNAGSGIGNSYLWSTGDTTNSINVNTSILADGSHWYSVKATSLDNCISKDSVRLVVSKIADTYLGQDSIICKLNNLLLDAGSGYNSYLWQNGNFAQTFLVDSNLGIGPHLIYVKVQNAFGCTQQDTIVITIDLCNGLVDYQIKDGIMVYPNPTNNRITIETETPFDIELIDQLGKSIVIFEKGFENNKLSTDLSILPNGIYYLKFTHLGKVIYKKVIKN